LRCAISSIRAYILACASPWHRPRSPLVPFPWSAALPANAPAPS